jgi:uncharacterized protein involved in exopolysaccharide biosynthesis
MELRYYLGIVWKWAWLIALSVIIAAASSYFASKAATPLYRTSTTLMVDVSPKTQIRTLVIYTPVSN